MISPAGKRSGIVYVPARQGFIPSSSSAASGGPPVDMFFDKAELRVGDMPRAVCCMSRAVCVVLVFENECF